MLKQHLTEDESKHSGQLGNNLRNDILDFITQRFQDSVIGQKLFGHHFHSLLCFDNCTSSVNEIEHKAMKYSQGGTQPHNSVDQTVRKLNDLRTRKDRRKNRQAACALDAVKAQKMERERHCSDLTNFVNKILLTEWDLSEDYENYQEADDTFYVKYRYEPESNRIKSNEKKTMTHSERIVHRCNWIIPRFERTRVVTLKDEGGKMVAKCTCALFERQGICCRHIYSLLGRGIILTDAIVRWWKKCIYYYGKPGKEEFAACLQNARDKTQAAGVIIDVSDICDTNSTSKSRDYFVSTIGNHRVRRNGHWTCSQQITRHAAKKPSQPTATGQAMPLTPLAFTTEIHLSETQLSQQSTQEDADSMPIPDAESDFSERDCSDDSEMKLLPRHPP